MIQIKFLILKFWIPFHYLPVFEKNSQILLNQNKI
jgi:hypothetical protein